MTAGSRLGFSGLGRRVTSCQTQSLSSTAEMGRSKKGEIAAVMPFEDVG